MYGIKMYLLGAFIHFKTKLDEYGEKCKREEAIGNSSF
jgi:hypothetical protein